MDDCTDFCNRLRSLHVENGNLPSRDHLIAHLQLSETDLLQGREIGNWSELQARSPQCTVCNIIREAVLDASGIAENTIEPERPIGVVLFPEEQSFRLCFPSRLGTQLAFVAKTPGQTSGPDNAKRIQEGRFSAAEILGWLKSCEEDHNCGRDSPVSRVCRCPGARSVVLTPVDFKAPGSDTASRHPAQSSTLWRTKLPSFD